MSPARMMPISRRTLLRTAAAAVVPMRPARAQSPAPLLLDDSRLNAVRIARHWRPAPVTAAFAGFALARVRAPRVAALR